MNSRKSIYQSQEFQKLESDVRSMIVLVSERAKPCATIGSKIRLHNILKKLGLYFVVKKREKDFVYDLTRKKKFYKEMIQVRSKRKQYGNMSTKEWQMNCDHVGWGDFYGYPQCCSESYTSDFKNGISPRERAIKQYFQYFIQHGTIPEEIHYVEYIPCKMDCTKTIELGLKNKKILDEMDIDASLEYWKSHVPLEELMSYVSDEDQILK